MFNEILSCIFFSYREKYGSFFSFWKQIVVPFVFMVQEVGPVILCLIGTWLAKGRFGFGTKFRKELVLCRLSDKRCYWLHLFCLFSRQLCKGLVTYSIGQRWLQANLGNVAPPLAIMRQTCLMLPTIEQYSPNLDLRSKGLEIFLLLIWNSHHHLSVSWMLIFFWELIFLLI